MSLLGAPLYELWRTVWETVRVGNGHIGGYRRRASLTRFAANTSCAVLAGMLARTFASNVTSDVLVSLMLSAALALVWCVGRSGIQSEGPVVQRPLGLGISSGSVDSHGTSV